MDPQSLDRIARSLAHQKPRRWALKGLAAGVVSVGLLTRGTRSTAAKDDFIRCLESCLAICEKQHNCRVTERDCAASCSNAML
ncbi:MAG TPA: hypothetical protein VFQ80_02135 [Thermomicrobiales bacterium]|jgi:hypothetical protein|nr:hypothetical protein [Thermomicrobiales bacterium]